MKLATLLYIKNRKGEYLLMERSKEPNKGLISPPGGKLKIKEAESPVECAVREVYEECLLHTRETEWKLIGIVTEKNYPSVGNIMIFLMEYKNVLDKLPFTCNEGSFLFVNPDNLKNYKLPVTDKFFIWDNILKNNKEVFMISLDCSNYPKIKQLIN